MKLHGWLLIGSPRRSSSTASIIFGIRVICCIALACCFSVEAFATNEDTDTRYQLILGQGKGVCRDFLRSLNEAPPEEKPMVCEQKVVSDHGPFSRPEWKKLDIERNIDLIYEAEKQIWLFTPAGKEPLSFATWRENFEGRLRSGEIKPLLMSVVLALGQSNETVVSYTPNIGACEKELKNKLGLIGPGGGHIFVLKKDSKNKLVPFSGTGTQDRVSVILYKGKPLFVSVVSNLSSWRMGLHSPVDFRSSEGWYVLGDQCAYEFDK